jgi:hypothetical protein
MTKEKLEEILEKHRKWLNGEEGGSRMRITRADLTGVNLYRADLRKADLHGISLRKANLNGADLSEADLSRTDLSEAELWSSCLSGTDLSGANLKGAFLSYSHADKAHLYNADLTDARLDNIDFRKADLIKANLHHACLVYTDLRDADLRGADLTDAEFDLSNLKGAKLDDSEKVRQGICLGKSIVGYKKCRRGLIVTLEIPKGAIVFGINKKDYRTNVAKVINISDGFEKALSYRNKKFVYRKGELVYPDIFDCQSSHETGGGIHFFKTWKEAEEYHY